VLGAERHQVVGAENSIWQRTPSEQASRGSLAGRDREFWHLEIVGRCEFERALLESGGESGAAINARAYVAGAIDERDARMTKVDEVLPGELSALHVVDRDTASVAARATPIEKHDRSAALADLLLKGRAMAPRRRDENTGNALLLKQPQLLAFPRAIARRAAEDNEMIDFTCCCFYSTSHLGEERVVDVKDDKSNRRTVDASELSRRRVAHEANLDDRLADPRERLLGDEVRSVQSVGDRTNGNANALSDVPNGHPLHGATLARASVDAIGVDPCRRSTKVGISPRCSVEFGVESRAVDGFDNGTLAVDVCTAPGASTPAKHGQVRTYGRLPALESPLSQSGNQGTSN
jgi:hypothetical protein